MLRQRVPVREFLTCLVDGLAVRCRGPRSNSLPALFRSVEAVSSLVVVLLLATRFAVLLDASPLAAPSFCLAWHSYLLWRVRPGPRAGRLPSRFAGSSWMAGPLWVVALVHCRSARGQILCWHPRPRSCDRVSSAGRVLRGQVQHRDPSPRGSTRRASTLTRRAACRVSASDPILLEAMLLDSGMLELIVHRLTIVNAQCCQRNGFVN